MSKESVPEHIVNRNPPPAINSLIDFPTSSLSLETLSKPIALALASASFCCLIYHAAFL